MLSAAAKLLLPSSPTFSFRLFDWLSLAQGEWKASTWIFTWQIDAKPTFRKRSSSGFNGYCLTPAARANSNEFWDDKAVEAHENDVLTNLISFCAFLIRFGKKFSRPMNRLLGMSLRVSHCTTSFWVKPIKSSAGLLRIESHKQNARKQCRRIGNSHWPLSKCCQIHSSRDNWWAVQVSGFGCV